MFGENQPKKRVTNLVTRHQIFLFFASSLVLVTLTSQRNKIKKKIKKGWRFRFFKYIPQFWTISEQGLCIQWLRHLRGKTSSYGERSKTRVLLQTRYSLLSTKIDSELGTTSFSRKKKLGASFFKVLPPQLPENTPPTLSLGKGAHLGNKNE